MSTPRPEGNYSIILPCDIKDFKDFISGLLGKPQTIRRAFPGDFDVQRTDIENLHHLLLQRLDQQNDSSFLQFIAVITFDDDSAVTLNSFEDFSVYNEVRPIVSVGITASWSFLVKFRDKEFPEKQEIDVTFSTSGYNGIGPHLPFAISRFYGASIRINHTARTWGADIDAMLTGAMEVMVKKPSKFRSFVFAQSGWITFILSCLLMIGAVAACIYAANSYANSLGSNLKEIVGVEARLEFLSKLLASGTWSRFGLYCLLFIMSWLIVSVIFALWFESRLSQRKPSFLVLTSTSTTHRIEGLAHYKKNWFAVFGSLVVAILIGIVSNAIFVVLVEKYLR
jgi:hypothetical protein